MDSPSPVAITHPAPAAGDARYLAALSSANMMALLPFSAYIASLPTIQAQWGLSNTLAGVVFSSYLVGFALASLVVGPLTDRFDAQSVFVGGLVLLVTANLLFPLMAHGIASAVLLRGLAGMGHAATLIPATRLVAKEFPGARRGTALGIFVAAGFIGTTFSYTFMGLLLARLSTWQAAYLVTALVGIPALPIVLWAGHNAAPPAGPGRAAQNRRGRFDLRVLADRAVALNSIAYALHTAELYLARLWFPLLLAAAFTAEGMAREDAAVRAATLSGFIFMLGIPGVFSGGWLSDRLGRSLGAALIFALSGLCSLLAGPLHAAPTLLLALGFVYGFTTAADSAIYSTSIIELAPPDRIGSAQAVQSFIGFTVGALVPVIAGSLLDAEAGATGWTLAFGFNALLAAAGIWSLLALRRLPAAQRMAGGRR